MDFIATGAGEWLNLEHAISVRFARRADERPAVPPMADPGQLVFRGYDMVVRFVDGTAWTISDPAVMARICAILKVEHPTVDIGHPCEPD